MVARVKQLWQSVTIFPNIHTEYGNIGSMYKLGLLSGVGYREFSLVNTIMTTHPMNGVTDVLIVRFQ